MKNLMNKMKNAFQKTAIRAKRVMIERRAEGYVDTAVKLIISVVIGGLLLAGLYALFNTTVIPNITTKITQMFSYAGS